MRGRWRRVRGVGPDGVVRNASALAVGGIVARLCAFAFGIALARSLGADEFGRYSFALALGMVVQPVADFGLMAYLGRETARRREPTEVALPVIVVAKLAVSAVVYAVVIAVAAVTITEPESIMAIAVLVLVSLIEGTSWLIYSYFQGRESMSFEARTVAVSAAARSAGGIALALTLQQLAPVILWIFAVSVAQLAVASRRMSAVVGGWGRLRPRWQRDLVDWRSVSAMGLMTVFVTAYLRIDTVLVGWFVAERAAGIYAAAYALLLGAQMLPGFLATAITPIFARTFDREPDRFAGVWRDGARLLLVMLPLSLLVSLLAGPITNRAYGPEFAESAPVLQILIWSCPFVALSLVVQAVLRGARREVALTWVSGLCAAANLLVNLWVIPRHGIVGAAWVSLGTEATNTAALLAVAMRARLVRISGAPILRVAAALGVLALAARILPGPVELVAMAGTVLYLGALLLMRVVTRDDLVRLRRAGRSPGPTRSSAGPGLAPRERPE